MIYKSESSKETQKLAALLACEISLRRETVGVPTGASGKTRFKNNQAVVLALKGNLGSGKTTFTQGFLRGLGVKKKITSPTFVIFKRYKLRAKSFKFVYHIDCYRIKKSQELLVLGIKEIFDNPKNIVLIEWPERIKNILPKERINVGFEYGKKENERRIVIG